MNAISRRLRRSGIATALSAWLTLSGCASSSSPPPASARAVPSASETGPSAPPPATTLTPAAGTPPGSGVIFNDCHVHLTDYIQEGIDVRSLLAVMGKRVQRVALFGIPLQQLWSTRVSGDQGPTYYLQADTPLYYYSFTDAYIAQAYLSLPPAERARFDPMITGFNPADMYGADHIKRVLKTFPGVFSGIGEFTIHKEFVSSKVAGEIASLQDPALDRIFDFAAEAGLVVLIHNDIDVPFPKPGAPPAYLEQMRALLARHPKTTVIWAHVGLGRVIRPVRDHAAMAEAILSDPAYAHVHFDISWNEVAKYLTFSKDSLKVSADLINRFPDRFLFGTDEVAPKSSEQYESVYRQYAQLFALLNERASYQLRVGNYVRLFDEARRRVRAWERANESAAK